MDRDRLWSGLMVAALAGDRAAYQRLLNEIVPFVRALARRHCGNPADVEELIQETLLTVHRVRQTYDPARPFTPWLAAIAMRRGIDGLRRRSRRARHETPEQPELYETFADPAANNDMESVGAVDEIGELLERLPPRQREALETVKLRQMSLAEASTASGQSVSALKVNVHRALRALRAAIQERRP
ncbi:MAG: sigma-70 family RNA polymerase sigma factor [Steroidobacteraceae bacterium]